MKKTCLCLVLVLGCTLILTACGKKVVEGTDDLRCDGVYRTIDKNSDGKYGYLRFFEEGKVHEMTDYEKLNSKVAFEKLYTVTNPNQLNRTVFASNTFKVNSNVVIESTVNGVNKKMKAPDVEFTYNTSLGTNSCYVTIKGDKIKMKMVNYQGNEYEYIYRFEECE